MPSSPSRPVHQALRLTFTAIAILLPLAVGMSAAAETPRVGACDTMVKVPRDGSSAAALGAEALAETRWGGSLHVELARGEMESAQLVLAAPADEALHNVRVTVGPLETRGDASWPRGCLSLWRLGFIDTHNLWAPHHSLGWLPDPLLPLDAPFDVAAGAYQPVWLRLQAVEGMAAGVYRGEVTVEADGCPAVRVPLRVTVWDFTLPATQHFTLSIPTWGGQWEAMYPGSVTPERWREYLDLLLDYRVSPFPLDEKTELDHCYFRGQREFCLHCFPVDYVPEDTTRKMGDLAAMWQGKAFGTEAIPYVLLGDEAPPQYYGNIREQGRLVREAAPGIRRQFTISPETAKQGFDYACEQLVGAADIAILGAANCYSTHEQSAQLRDAGFSLWWYYVASHYYIPERGLEARQIFWRHWKYRVPGQLHWGASYWGDVNIAGKDGKKWPEVPWDSGCSRSGDGYLVYPAAGGTGVWPSVRLELLRDGVEDYEYFHLLRSLVEGRVPGSQEEAAVLAESRRLLEPDDSLVKSYKEYSPRPGAYRSYRSKLARAIVATERIGGAGQEGTGEM